ncbi:MAG: MarR family transcriptional regulator [Alphaproteobacteria bacterium]|jgi:DNA-binding MarR family transcriptional regulator|nr:MarR family transcriptional regulator [Alphaproteobacteria bacterium]
MPGGRSVTARNTYLLERQVGFIMRRVMQRHIAIFSSLIPEMTPTQFAALAKLCELGQASQNELGRLTAMDVATIKGVVDRLRARGLVEASPLVGDRRRLMLTPTEAGRDLHDELVTKASEVTRRTLAPLDKQERDRLIKLLDRLV